MATLSASPQAPTSMLVPSYTSPDLHPRGGILLNAGEGSTSPRLTDSTSTPPSFLIPLPASPLDETPPSLRPPTARGTSVASGASRASGASAHSGASADNNRLPPPRIRFAPLPDPRPRSLSTGRNIAWSKPGMDGDGRHFEIRGVENQEVVYDDDETSSDEDDKEREKRGRSWSKSMSWKGTKSLLTTGKLPPKPPVDKGDSADEGYSSGASLKKSVSTGGMIGSSPFRWTAETDRRKSMQGLMVRGTSPGPGHRRNSSLEPSGPASLGTSAPVVKMLNGRMYGSRRASAIAAAQREAREKMEPAFIEWGHGKAGSGLGSNAPKNSGGGFLEEEGSGMEWVRRRREERQKKQREEAEQRLRESGSQSAPEDDRRPQPHLSSSQSSGESPLTLAITPSIKVTDLPPTPRIEVIEPPPAGATPDHKFAPSSDTGGLAVGAEKRAGGTQAIDIAPRRDAHEPFPNSSPRDADDEGDEDDEEDDGDFSHDEDEEEEEDTSRTTAAAAGREIISRHH